MPRIGIDPGHGGPDPGAPGVNNYRESDFTLELSRMVRDRIVAQDGFTVYMTREADVSPGDASARARLMLAQNCDYGISIHFNAFTNSTANGTEIYIPHGETHGNIEGRIMPELVKLFAPRNPVYKAMSTASVITDKKLDEKTFKFGHVSASLDYFGVIRTSWAGGLSADLLETCFITNAKDMEAYNANKPAIATAIAKAIVEGFGKSYKEPSQPIVPPDPVTPASVYRVRKTWQDSQSQIGAYTLLNSAKKQADDYKANGYKVFDADGVMVYDPLAASPPVDPNPELEALRAENAELRERIKAEAGRANQAEERAREAEKNYTKVSGIHNKMVEAIRTLVEQI